MTLIERAAAAAIDAVSRMRMRGADSAEAAEVQRRIAALLREWLAAKHEPRVVRREWTGGEPEREEMER